MSAKRPEPQPVTTLREQTINWFGPAVPVAVGILLWHVATVVLHIPRLILPSPVEVVEALIGNWSILQAAIWPTVIETLAGFGLSVAVGIPLAILIVSSKLFERAIYPPLVASQVVPKVALAPLFVIWFGFGLMPKIMVAFSIAVFPIVIDTVVGLRQTERELVLMARSMGAGPVKIFTKIRFMKALPSIFGGLKVAITLAVVGAVVGEFISANRGLGYMLLVANGRLDTPLLFADLLLLVIVGLILFLAIELLERIVLPAPMRESGLDGGQER